jgi:hypothetical protein
MARECDGAKVQAALAHGALSHRRTRTVALSDRCTSHSHPRTIAPSHVSHRRTVFVV